MPWGAGRCLRQRHASPPTAAFGGRGLLSSPGNAAPARRGRGLPGRGLCAGGGGEVAALRPGVQRGPRLAATFARGAEAGRVGCGAWPPWLRRPCSPRLSGFKLARAARQAKAEPVRPAGAVCWLGAVGRSRGESGGWGLCSSPAVPRRPPHLRGAGVGRLCDPSITAQPASRQGSAACWQRDVPKAPTGSIQKFGFIFIKIF